MQDDPQSVFSQTIMNQKYAQIKRNGTKETWEDIAKRVVYTVMESLYVPKDIKDQTFEFVRDKKFIPGGRYLYATGRPYHQIGNCFLFKALDSREGWSDLLQKASMALMTGGGIGVDYSQIRPEGKPIKKTGGSATGPLALMNMVNECGRYIMQGGSRRSAIWAGLNWKHSDVQQFIQTKNWIQEIRDLKEKDFSFPATLDGTNISVLLDDEFFEAYNDPKHTLHEFAHSTYWSTVKRMLKTSEPGFSIDIGKNKEETLRNACTEITSSDDSDMCNLGAINLARIESLEEMKMVVECSTVFLLCGTVYGDVPFAKVDEIRNKNRRLGLGLMGIHEWLLIRGKKYDIDEELEKYLKIYSTSTKIAKSYAKDFDISLPIKTRAIAPTGTIALVAETTQGIEPLFCVSYKRRYLKHKTWNYQYIIDNIAEKLIKQGVNSESIEDAYTLSLEPERRMRFQAWIQGFVDHAISSTMNIPAWGSKDNNEDTVQSLGNTMLEYLPKLRGFTVYADGSRGGQILTPVKYNTAQKQIGNIFVESNDICDITKAGSCSS